MWFDVFEKLPEEFALWSNVIGYTSILAIPVGDVEQAEKVPRLSDQYPTIALTNNFLDAIYSRLPLLSFDYIQFLMKKHRFVITCHFW